MDVYYYTCSCEGVMTLIVQSVSLSAHHPAALHCLSLSSAGAPSVLSPDSSNLLSSLQSPRQHFVPVTRTFLQQQQLID